MEMLGLPLDKVLDNCDGTMSISDVYRCAIQMISVLKHLHNKNLVHRDVKPQNLMFGLPPKQNTLYLIDFGSVDTWKSVSGVIKTTGKFAGTPEYASYRVHNGAASRPRDDLISVGYILIKLLNGKLPWSDCKSNEEVAKKMNKIDVNELCEDVTEPIKDFMIKLYDETEEINHDDLKRLFEDGLEGEDENIFDFVYCFYLFN